MSLPSTPKRAPLEGVVAAVAGQLGEERRVGVDVVWLAVALTPVMVADLSRDGHHVSHPPGYAWTLITIVTRNYFCQSAICISKSISTARE